MEEVLIYKKIDEEAKTPTKQIPLSAGFDLYSVEEVEVGAFKKCLVSTGLKISVPPGTYGRIAPKSGLAIHHHIGVGGGVIDEGYQGVVKIIIFNHGENSFLIKKGDAVAQLICEKIIQPTLKEVNDPWEVSERGENGFGSTTLKEKE